MSRFLVLSDHCFVLMTQLLLMCLEILRSQCVHTTRLFINSRINRTHLTNVYKAVPAVVETSLCCTIIQVAPGHSVCFVYLVVEDEWHLLSTASLSRVSCEIACWKHQTGMCALTNIQLSYSMSFAMLCFMFVVFFFVVFLSHVSRSYVP